MSNGYYVIDVCGTPVDKLHETKRDLKVEHGLDPLVREIKRLNPDRILVVKVSIYEKVKSAILKAGLAARLVNQEPIPFPSHGNQGAYRRRLVTHLQ